MKPFAMLRRRAPVRFAVVSCALLLAACSSKPPVPDWQMNAQVAATKATEAYLSGNARVEQLEWERARAEVARTGRADLLARLELMRCAAQVASLVVAPCDRFEALRPDASAPEQAYADYLAGRMSPQQVPLLPEAQRKVAAAGEAATLALKTRSRAWWLPGCCFRPGAPALPWWPQPPRRRRPKAGAGRCWPGWYFRCSGPRRRGMQKPLPHCAAAWASWSRALPG
mgnify:CR=1 FL=1